MQLQHQQEYAESNFNRKRLTLMTIIFVAVVGALIIIIINADVIFNPNNTTEIEIENGDYVQFSYNIWIDENSDGSATDEWDGGNVANIAYNNTISRIIFYEESSGNNTFSQTFVNSLLGMQVEDSKYITIPGVVDEDSNDIDDETGEPIVGFQSYPSLKGKELIIQVTIIDIVKPGEDNFPAS